MRLTLSGIAAILLISSCGNGEQQATTETTAEVTKSSKLEKASWILGNWSNETPQGTFTEHWELTNDHLYTGHGFLISGKGDTLFSEFIKLELSGDTLYYKPVVSGQNDGKETVFTEKSISENEMVFENPTHDFPQRIIYKRPTDSTLYARIEGKADGKDMQEEYQFKKKTN